MHQARIHHHSRNPNQEIYGQRLEPGDLIATGDVYDCTSGVWRPCDMLSHDQPILQGSKVVVIRPLPVKVFGQQSVAI